MSIEIKKISEETIPGYYHCLDSIARERKFLGYTQAPPYRRIKEWIQENLKKDALQFVALVENEVVGWVDIVPRTLPGFQHVAGLGIGIIKKCRRMGVGTLLLTQSITAAKKTNLKKLELDVYSDNESAIRLYKKFGFSIEGQRIKARYLDGKYNHIVLMGLFLDSDDSTP